MGNSTALPNGVIMSIRSLMLASLLAFGFSFAAEAVTPTSLQCLWATYKNFHISGDQRHIVFADQSTMPFSDGTADDFFRNISVLLDNPTSLEQMFFIPYIFGFQKDAAGKYINPIPGINQDPGRVRYERFFLKTYGASEAIVEKDLVLVKWVDGKKISFNKKFGASVALQKVSDQLSALVAARPELKKYVISPLGGTFNWRTVAGTKNLSVHSFGVAIDINLDHTNYWKWETERNGRIAYKNQIPLEVVEVFEKNGFIWGGKWYHYDTMHFEYRPELLMKAHDCETEFAKYREN